MFDKLVESNAEAAEFKPRRKFFLVSSVIVGLLFVTAVIASIYAADYGLGPDNFEMADLLTPIAQTEPVDQPDEPARPDSRYTATTNDIIRRVAMASVEDTSRVPTIISTAVNPYRSIPDSGRFQLGPRDSDGFRPSAGGSGDGPGSGPGSSTGSPINIDDRSGSEPPAPPPVKRNVIKSVGIVTGKATLLPKPPYPRAAIALNISGSVSVQVTIDEEGNVISAHAIDGNPIFRRAAEDAAKRAKFSPTTLSKVPVKVTGVIVYAFTRQ